MEVMHTGSQWLARSRNFPALQHRANRKTLERQAAVGMSGARVSKQTVHLGTGCALAELVFPVHLGKLSLLSCSDINSVFESQVQSLTLVNLTACSAQAVYLLIYRVSEGQP